MEIIDNFGLPSKQKEGFNPWLENILDMVKEKTQDKKFTLRLTGNRTNNSIIYSLRNSQNKTSADIFKRNRMFYLELYKRDLPDQEKAIKPDSTMVSGYVFQKGGIDDLATIADLIAQHITMSTPYSENKVKRIKVISAKQPGTCGNSFTGGQITGIVYNDNTVELVVENDKVRYHLSKESVEGCRLSLLKYIVFNDKNEFALINSPEFDVYYEMVDE